MTVKEKQSNTSRELETYELLRHNHMNILILSSINGAVGAKSLQNAFIKNGHTCHIVSSDDTAKLPVKPDVVIPRVSPKSIEKTVSRLKTLEAEYPLAVFTATASRLENSFSKLQTYRDFVKNNISTPATWNSVDEIDGDVVFPMIVKPINGNRGIGIKLVHTKEELRDMLREGSHIAQEFIAESMGIDIRAFVVGDEVVASMIRSAPKGEVVANIAQGANAAKIDLDEETRQLAVGACQALGLKIGGVDLIKSNRGMLVLEVNPSPGFKVGEVCGVDIPGIIVDYLEIEAGGRK